MTKQSADSQRESVDSKTVVVALVGCLVLFFSSLAFQTFFQIRELATTFMSPEMWQRLIVALGGVIETDDQGVEFGYVSEFVLLAILGSLVGMITLISCICRKALDQNTGILKLVTRLIGWSSLPGIWFFLWLIASMLGLTGMVSVLMATPQFWVSLSLAGMLCVAMPVRESDSLEDVKPGTPWSLWMVATVYAVVFVAMNWGLYFNLMLPHGDSAMYEEHLWNIWHGKGFRSYLDQGLFLGEHIQVAHLILLPVHFVWPSHLMLELAETLILATGVFPIYWMAKRHSQNQTAALMLATAFLLSFPLQFLDISIDLKTFRPINFGMTAMLFAIDQFERKRFVSSSALLIVALSAKEDFAIVTFCFGFWVLNIALLEWYRNWKQQIPTEPLWRFPQFLFGLGWTVFSPIYLKSALTAIVWFRSGVEVHYAGYFSKFGESTGEIIFTMLTHPSLVVAELATGQTLIYALCILFPLGFLPLFSPTRLLTAGPLFVLLCLNELASDPRHHFHAPLMPLVLWAAASGLGNFGSVRSFLTRVFSDESPWMNWADVTVMSRFACFSAFSIGLWFSMSPFGFAFWDPGSKWNWRKLYIPSERTQMFAKIYGDLPKDARIASTDYVHPRFTHHERSYDYSNYKREVAGGTVGVPDDTDFIVIDTQHPYSEIKSPSQVRELQQEPEKWKLWRDSTNGYFIVLERKKIE